jgi:hypothetical protein
MIRALASATIAATLVLLPAQVPAADGGGSCDKTAAVASGTVVAIDPATGTRLQDALQELRRGARRPYAVSGGPATIEFQGVSYELAADSEFLLGCFGESKAVGARFPRLVLGSGRAEVTTAEGRTGAVSNGAAMVNPEKRIAMTFTVRAPSYLRLKASKDRDAPGRLAVTPYAGPRKGTCRYVKASASLDAEADTARYDGKRARTARTANARAGRDPALSLARCCRVSWDLWNPGSYSVMGRIDHPGRLVDRFFMTAGGRLKDRGWKCTGNTIGDGASEIRASLKPSRFPGGRTYRVVVVSVARGKTYFTEAAFKIPRHLGRDGHYRSKPAHRRLAGDPRHGGGEAIPPDEPPSPRAGEVEWLGPDEVTVRSGESVTVELRYTGDQPLARGARVYHTDGFGNFLLEGPCGDDTYGFPIEGLAPGATTSIQVPVPCPPGDGVFYLAAVDNPNSEGVVISPTRRLRLRVVAP